MNELKLFGEELVDFIYQTHLKTIPEYYYDALLNYLGVAYLGADQFAVSLVIDTLLDDYEGKYYPLHRKEKVSLSDVALIDCFSSAVQAFDDIHFETTTHPCGPVMSAILALARIQEISLHDALNALYIGMEVECRVATMMFSKNTNSSSGWYTTGIVGGIGAAAALSHLLQFNKDEIKSALALSCNYASGIRGSHGSMTGSFVPAIASKNGFMATMLVKKGVTCSFESLVGDNGLIKQITSHPDIHLARQGLGQKKLSLQSSCKPYPYGFISFSAIALLTRLEINTDDIKTITVEVSSRVKMLGSNASPQTMYDAFVSLPYIIASVIVNKDNAYDPLKDDFAVSSQVQSIMKKIMIKEKEDMEDDEIYIIINGKEYYLKDAPGSTHHPMDHQDVINKFKKIVNIKQKERFIEQMYHKDVKNIYHFITQYFNS